MTAAPIRSLPAVRLLGRQPVSQGPVPCFYTACGIECLFTGSELALCLDAGFTLYEPWISVELNGAWIARFPVQAGRSRVTLFRGMTPGVPKHVRVLKDVQAMHDDPDHFLLIEALAFEGGTFLPLPEPAYRLEFVGNSITSGEGAIGAVCEEDWVAPFFSAVNHYARMTADALHAEWRIVSQSGWGLLSSWDNDPRRRVMDHYDTVCGLAAGPHNEALGAQQPYRFDSWKADAVILNLGTNDDGAMGNPPWTDPETGRTFAQRPTPEHVAELEQAAVDALKKVRARNPDAWIVWAFGMLGEGRMGQVLRAAVARARAECGDPGSDHFLSPAPQAVPQAVGFLSPAPQAVPQAEAAFPSVSLWNRFFKDISFSSLSWARGGAGIVM